MSERATRERVPTGALLVACALSVVALVAVAGARWGLVAVVVPTVAVLARHLLDRGPPPGPPPTAATNRSQSLIIDSVAAGVIVLDQHRRVQRANPAGCRLLGVDVGTAIGRPPGAGVTSFTDRWGRTLPDSALPSVRAVGGEDFEDELIGMVRPDGTRIWTSVSGRAVEPMGRISDGVVDDRAPVAVLTIVDVTGRITADLASEAETAQLRHRALHDSLTGLPNRTMLMDRLAHAKTNASRRGSGTGLILIDLDGFKGVNDTLGHAAGDELLVQVAVRLRTALRASDTAARLGGDEFVVLCEDLNPAMAGLELEKVGSRIQALLNETYMTTLGPAGIGASVGWAVALPGEDLDLELVVAADEAMLSDKRQRKVERGTVRHDIVAPPVIVSSSAMLSVYIVDDDPAMRLLASRILESTCSELDVIGEAADGETAIEAILRLAPDLVLCDVMMPGLSGPEVVTAVRRANPGQRFIFWSATTAPELERYQEDLGVPYVLKDRIEELPTALLDASRLATAPNPAPIPQDRGRLSRR